MNIRDISNAVIEACDDVAAWVNHVPLDFYVHDFSEEEMQAFCQCCWSSDVPLAHYGDKVVSYYTITKSNRPLDDIYLRRIGLGHNDFTICLYEIQFFRCERGWKNHNKCIGSWETLHPYSRTEDFFSLPSYGPRDSDCIILSRESQFYDRATKDWTSGEDLCKYGDLLRYLGESHKALEWYEKSDAAGFAWAAYNIGDYYASATDNLKAKQWFARAAELGLPEGMERLKLLMD